MNIYKKLGISLKTTTRPLQVRTPHQNVVKSYAKVHSLNNSAFPIYIAHSLEFSNFLSNLLHPCLNSELRLLKFAKYIPTINYIRTHYIVQKTLNIDKGKL